MNNTEKVKRRSESLPPKESGYTEQEDLENPKILEYSCSNCDSYKSEITKRTVKWSYERNNCGTVNQSREFETDKPICSRYGRQVDDLFGTCNFFKMA